MIASLAGLANSVLANSVIVSVIEAIARLANSV